MTRTRDIARRPAGMEKCREAGDEERCWLEPLAVGCQVQALAVALELVTGIAL